MNKNLLAAASLSLLVYALWVTWLQKHAPPPAPAPEAVSSAAQAQPQTAPAAGTLASTLSAAPAPIAGKTLPFDYNGAHLSFTSAAGALSSYAFPDVSGPVELLPRSGPGFLATTPELDFPRLDGSRSGVDLEASPRPGLSLKKEFIWGGDLPVLRISATNSGKTPMRLEGWSLSLGPGLSTLDAEQKTNAKLTRAIASYREPSRLHSTFSKLKPGLYSQAWDWVGIDNHYFLSAAFLKQDDFPSVTVETAKDGDSEAPRLLAQAAPVDLEPGRTRTWEIPFYIGPKNYLALRGLGRGLEDSIDFGFFGVLGKACFLALNAIHGVVGNWGFAIITLTLLLQLCMYPLTLKSLTASVAMQKLQPKIKELQAKYKDDPKRMNVEMMELYKTSGTNPLGGCLPMLLQLPIFWAFYTMLRNCWALHGAPFIGWVHDLSAYDPFYVMPVTVGLLMFLQQRVNPPSGDPDQQKMFMFMPVMFTFMFIKFPAGLVLYWMCSNMFTLTTQYFIRRRLNAAA